MPFWCVSGCVYMALFLHWPLCAVTTTHLSVILLLYSESGPPLDAWKAFNLFRKCIKKGHAECIGKWIHIIMIVNEQIYDACAQRLSLEKTAWMSAVDRQSLLSILYFPTFRHSEFAWIVRMESECVCVFRARTACKPFIFHRHLLITVRGFSAQCRVGSRTQSDNIRLSYQKCVAFVVRVFFF